MALVLAVALGCGPAEKPTGSVSGVVTFAGTPVEEGRVSFYSKESGAGADAMLGAGGKYEATGLTPGAYQVTVQPPMETVDAGPNSPPSERPKDVKNIPVNYRKPATSGLSTEVKAGSNTYDIAMTK